MNRLRPSLAVLTAVAAAGLAGCAGAGPQAIDLPAVALAAITFDDLAIVLGRTVNADGAVEPTALAVNLPRLEHQLTLLGQPWPAELRAGQFDQRLAWLYNTRTAWSLRIVARELTRDPKRPDRFVLPPTIGEDRLTESGFVLDGHPASLAWIDGQLAAWDDFRVAASAPGATDLDGRLPREPFSAGDVRAAIPRRFNEYVLDDRRIVIDHQARQLQAPPALWQFAPRLTADYDRRYRTAGATLATALKAYLDPPGRGRLDDALGYPAVQHTARRALWPVQPRRQAGYRIIERGRHRDAWSRGGKPRGRGAGGRYLRARELRHGSHRTRRRADDQVAGGVRRLLDLRRPGAVSPCRPACRGGAASGC